MYRKHISTPPQLTEGRLSGIQTHDTYAKQTTVYILEQLQKLLFIEKDLSNQKRPKRFLGALIAAASAVGSLFSIGISVANSISVSALQRHMGELDEEMPEIQQRLDLQQEQLQDLGKTLKGTVLAGNLHSALLNHTLHALDTLSVIVRDDITYVQVVKDLMQDLMREVSSTVNSLSAGMIPTCLVYVDLVESILKSATTTVVEPSQVHLAFSLGSAIPISVDLQNLEIGFVINLPIIFQQNVYHLKSVMNVWFWQDNTHVHLKTPPLLAYHDENPSLYLIPNLSLCTKTKDIHWICPSTPFIRDVTNYLCGLRANAPKQKCQGSMSTRSEETPTRVKRACNKWLVNTPAFEAIMAYDRHDTSTKLSLINQTMFFVVPQGATIHIGDIVLHHLNPDRHDAETEIMDAFKGQNFTIDTTIQQQLIAQETSKVKFSVKPTGLTTIFGKNLSRSPTYAEHPISLVALVLLLSGSIITTAVAYRMYKYIQKLQAKLDSLFVIPPRMAATVSTFSQETTP